MSSHIKNDIWSIQNIETLIDKLKRGEEVENASFKNEIVEFNSIDFDFRNIGLHNIKTPIIFKNCVFSRNGDLQNLDVSYLNSSIIFDECKAEKITIKNSTIEGSMKFHKNSINEINIENSFIENGVLSISNNETDSSIEINQGSFKEISYRDNQVNLGLSGSKIGELKIFRNKGKFNISNCKVERSKVNYNKLGSLFKIESTYIMDSFLFEENKFETIHAESQDIESFEFAGNSGELILQKIICENLPDFRNNKFSQIRFDSISNSETSYKINAGNVDVIQLDKIDIGRIEIRANRVSSLYLSELNSEHLHCTVEISSLKECLISKSNIGNFLIQKSKIENLNIEECKIKDVDILGNTLNSIQFNNNDALTSLRFIETSSGKVNIRDSNVQQLVLNNTKIENLEFAQEEKVDALIQEIHNVPTIEISNANRNDSNWFFNNDSILKFEISFSDKIDKLIINEDTKKDNNITDFRFSNCNIKEILCQRLRSCVYSQHSEYSSFEVINYGSTTRISGSCFQSENDRFEKLFFRHYSSEVIHIENADITEKLEIKKGLIDSIEILNDEVEKNVLPKSHIKDLSLHACDVKSIRIESIFADRISLNSLQPTELQLKKITIKNLFLEDFKRHKVDNGHEMSFINTMPNFKGESISFKNSNLDGLILNSCYFRSFEELEVYSSKFDGVYCTATTWPQKVVSFENVERTQQDQFEIREACRQLKLAMGNHQDRVSELKFHALEMNAYRKITWEGRSVKSINDILSLLGGLSNDFGQNWLKPLLLALFCITLIYSFMISSHFSTTLLSSDFKYFFNWEDYFHLFNPTHRTSQLSMGGAVSGLTAFLDFLSRLVSAFFIYQVATAFRKFRK